MTILAKQAEIATTNTQSTDKWLNDYLVANHGFSLAEYHQYQIELANPDSAINLLANSPVARISSAALNEAAYTAFPDRTKRAVQNALTQPELMGETKSSNTAGRYWRVPNAQELAVLRGEVVPETKTKGKAKKTKSKSKASEADVSTKAQALVIESAETFEETPSDANNANNANDASDASDASQTQDASQTEDTPQECHLNAPQSPTSDSKPKPILEGLSESGATEAVKSDASNVVYVDFGFGTWELPDYLTQRVDNGLGAPIEDEPKSEPVPRPKPRPLAKLTPPATDDKEEWAKFWFGFGFKLFPLQFNSKKPACKHGFKDAVDNLQALKALGYDSKTNLAIATGDTTQGYRVVVLDIDTKKGKDGHVVISKLAGKLGTLPATLTAKTPSGGRHLFFKYPADKEIKSSSDLFKDLGLGFDTRSMGGYVAAAPSTIDGVPYALVTDLLVAELPAAWLEALATKALPPNTSKGRALSSTRSNASEPSQPSSEAFNAAFGTIGNLALSAMPLEQPKAPNVPTDVLALLKSVDAGLSRVEWLQVLSALSAFSDGCDVARSWSATSPTKFDSSTWDKDWSRALEFNGGAPASIGVIANLAKAAGATISKPVSVANSFDASGVTEEELQEIASDMFERARSGDYDLMNTLPQALIDPAIRADTVRQAHKKLFESKTAEQQANIKRPLFVNGKLSLPNLAFLAAKQLTLRLMVESGALEGAKISDDSRAGFVSAVAKALLRDEFTGEDYKTLLDNIGHGVRNAQLKSNTTLQRVSTGIPDAGNMATAHGLLEDVAHFALPENFAWPAPPKVIERKGKVVVMPVVASVKNIKAMLEGYGITTAYHNTLHQTIYARNGEILCKDELHAHIISMASVNFMQKPDPAVIKTVLAHIPASQINPYIAAEANGTIPKWDGVDRLTRFMDVMQLLLSSSREKIELCFRKLLFRSVWMATHAAKLTSEGVIDYAYRQQSMLIITGENQVGKSRLLESLMSVFKPIVRDQEATYKAMPPDKMELKSEHDIRAILSGMLVEIAEISNVLRDSRTEGTYGKLKTLLGVANDSVRTMYTETQRMRSRSNVVAGTANHVAMLTDEHSRKFAIVTVRPELCDPTKKEAYWLQLNELMRELPQIWAQVSAEMESAVVGKSLSMWELEALYQPTAAEAAMIERDNEQHMFMGKHITNDALEDMFEFENEQWLAFVEAMDKIQDAQERIEYARNNWKHFDLPVTIANDARKLGIQIPKSNQDVTKFLTNNGLIKIAKDQWRGNGGTKGRWFATPPRNPRTLV